MNSYLAAGYALVPLLHHYFADTPSFKKLVKYTSSTCIYKLDSIRKSWGRFLLKVIGMHATKFKGNL